MLSYQHAFHAGNHADILKHCVLSFALDSLNKKDKPYTFFDTHSGSGLYDLYDNRSLKTGEAQKGILSLLENLDNWDITGFEEYLGRKCAVINGTTDIKIPYESISDEEENFDICTCEFTIMIDYETGIWMKSDIKEKNYGSAHYTFTITDIALEDDAKPLPMSKEEFKQAALNDCVKRVCVENEQTCTIEAVNESDLAFLD